MKCSECGKDIPPERLEILPETRTCVVCSKEQRRIGITVWDKKTPELVIVKQEEADFFWRMEKVDGRLSRLK